MDERTKKDQKKIKGTTKPLLAILDISLVIRGTPSIIITTKSKCVEYAVCIGAGTIIFFVIDCFLYPLSRSKSVLQLLEKNYRLHASLNSLVSIFNVVYIDCLHMSESHQCVYS